jgi:hypothetical protein
MEMEVVYEDRRGMKQVQGSVQWRVFVSAVLNDHLPFAESDVRDTCPTPISKFSFSDGCVVQYSILSTHVAISTFLCYNTICK